MKEICPGAFFSKVPRTFGAEEPFVKLQSACFEKLIFKMFFNVRKTKRITKFDGLEARRCEDVTRIVAPEIGLESFGTYKLADVLQYDVTSVSDTSCRLLNSIRCFTSISITKCPSPLS